jgi:DNA-directed RNA polymerase subunit K/omega
MASEHPSKYEEPRVIARRLRELHANAPPLVPVDWGRADPLEVARREYAQGLLRERYVVVRKAAGGEPQRGGEAAHRSAS